MNQCEILVQNAGVRFVISKDDSILDGALAQGVKLPHQCRGASCGECKSRVIRGEVNHGWALGFAITDEEKDQGFCLMCQARPVSDHLELVTVKPMPSATQGPKSIQVEVVALTRLTPRVSRLVLSQAAGDSFRYEAGDYAELVLPGIQPNRMYSFAGPPRSDGLLEFFVALHPSGKASQYVTNELLVGDLIQVCGPFGSCRMPEGEGPVVGLAGGTGLAPVLAIFEESLSKGSKDAHHLLLSVREDKELFALDRLRGLVNRHDNFGFDVLVTDEPSRFCVAKEYAPQWLKRKYRSLADSRAVIGGSPGFVEACVGACAALGMPAGKMATDSFNPTVPV